VAKSLEQILGYMPLLGVIREVKTGIPDLLPPAFWNVKSQVLMDRGRYIVTRGTRRPARLNVYGSPARLRELRPLDTKDVKLMHSYEVIQMDPHTLRLLHNYESYDLQKMGIQEVDRQQAEFRAYFDNLRLSAVYSMLSLAAIYFDQDGNLLPTSSGAYITIDFEVPAENKNQLNGVISASWALPNTNIPAQLIALRQRAQQLSGYPLKYAFYGTNIPTWLTQNNYVQDYLSRNPNFAVRFLETAEVPDGLFGFTWVPVHSAFFEDQNGVNQTFFNPDSIAFTPDINSDVYELLEGSYGVPTTFNAVGDIPAALRTLKDVWGMFAYAVPVHNPLGVQYFSGDTFLPVWKAVKSLFVADTTP
jgi:hypothetical protein